MVDQPSDPGGQVARPDITSKRNREREAELKTTSDMEGGRQRKFGRLMKDMRGEFGDRFRDRGAAWVNSLRTYEGETGRGIPTGMQGRESGEGGEKGDMKIGIKNFTVTMDTSKIWRLILGGKRRK